MDVTEAVAERVDMIGALVGADTTVTVVVLKAAGTVHNVLFVQYLFLATERGGT